MASDQIWGGRFASAFRAALLAALALPACESHAKVEESLNTQSEALVDGGVGTTAATPDIAAVALIRTTWIWTAHCSSSPRA